MDVNQVLQNTLSPDGALRQNAEQQLFQAAEVDFSGYVTTLAHELANDQVHREIRMAAGLALKNAFTARDMHRLRELQEKWLRQVPADIKRSVKELALRTLAASETQVGQAAAQFITSIAAIEIPRDQWPELMPTLVQYVNDKSPQLRQLALTTIGYICNEPNNELRSSLDQHSNAILTAVVQGVHKDESSSDVRYAAIEALLDSLEFVRSNFDNEGERNYIMQVVCEATQSDDPRVQAGAFGCLIKIMALYYEQMQFYMEKALFGLTVMGMKSDNEDVAKLAVEFWSTVCEEEIQIADDNRRAHENGVQMRPDYNFARVATQEVVPVLLQLLTGVDEDADDDEINPPRAATNCLALYAQAVGQPVVPPVLSFIEQNLRHQDWHYRDAALSAFGALTLVPDETALEPLVKQALPVLMSMISDEAPSVQDSAAYTLCRICENIPQAIDPTTHLAPLVASLFGGLSSDPHLATSCCAALNILAGLFVTETDDGQNPLTPHFKDSVTHILQVTDRNDVDSQVRTSAYDVLNTFVIHSASQSLSVVANLSDVILQRLENTLAMRNQIVNVEDRVTLENIQLGLSDVLMAIIQRLEHDIQPQADRIMRVILQILHSVGGKSSVPEALFMTVGALASALEKDFVPYVDSFAPFLYNALGSQDDPGLCATAVGFVGDLSRALGEMLQPYCDMLMNHLLNDLRSTTLSNQLKPSILTCFGEIAQAILGNFETYLAVVAQVLQQAASVLTTTEGNFEMQDYLDQLLDGIMDAWSGIIIAVRESGKQHLLRPYVESIFELLRLVQQDHNLREDTVRAALGIVGDLALAFHNGEFAHLYRQDWVTGMIRDARSNRDFDDPRTLQVARWARELVKNQTNNPSSAS